MPRGGDKPKSGNGKYLYSGRDNALRALRVKKHQDLVNSINKRFNKDNYRMMSRDSLLNYMEAVDQDNPNRRVLSTFFYEVAIRDLIKQVIELTKEVKNERKKRRKCWSCGEEKNANEDEGRIPDGDGTRISNDGGRIPDYDIFEGSMSPGQFPGSVDDRIKHRRGLIKGDVSGRNLGEFGISLRTGKIEIDRRGTLRKDAGKRKGLGKSVP